MDAATLPAPPRGANLLDRVFEIYLGQPLSLLLFSALYVFSTFGLERWAEDASGPTFLRRLGATLAGHLVGCVAIVASTLVVQGRLRGQPLDLTRVVAGTAARLPSLLGVYLLYTLGWMAWSLLFLVPGLVFAVAAGLSFNVLGATGQGGPAAIRRSRVLTRGRWWRVLGTVVLLSLPAGLLSVLFQYLPREAGFYWLEAGISGLLAPIPLVGVAVLYFRLEERLDAVEAERPRRAPAAAPAAARAEPAFAAPSHAEFDPGAFGAFEHRGWQQAASAYQAAFEGLTAQAAEELLDAADVKEGTRLLDVASGPGHVAGLAASRGARVTGSDFSPAMLAIARAKHPEVEFRVADAEALPFEDGSFDAVTMAFLLGHLGHPDRALEEARRVLRPGGRLAASWWQPFDRAVPFGFVLDAVRELGRVDVALPEGPPFDRFADPDQLAGALVRSGFDDVRLSPHPMTWRLASGEDVFEAYLNGTVRTAGLLRGQSPEALAGIRARVARSAEAYRDDSGIALPMPCWVVSGRRTA